MKIFTHLQHDIQTASTNLNERLLSRISCKLDQTLCQKVSVCLCKIKHYSVTV